MSEIVYLNKIIYSYLFRPTFDDHVLYFYPFIFYVLKFFLHSLISAHLEVYE